MQKVTGERLTQACGYLTWVIDTTQSVTDPVKRVYGSLEYLLHLVSGALSD
jgi:hypothetical protein